VVGLQIEILSLLPSLSTGFNGENFNLVEKIPDRRDLLNIYANGELIEGGHLTSGFWLVSHHSQGTVFIF
jgi:hypothetical protein